MSSSSLTNIWSFLNFGRTDSAAGESDSAILLPFSDPKWIRWIITRYWSSTTCSSNTRPESELMTSQHRRDPSFKRLSCGTVAFQKPVDRTHRCRGWERKKKELPCPMPSISPPLMVLSFSISSSDRPPPFDRSVRSFRFPLASHPSPPVFRV